MRERLDLITLLKQGVADGVEAHLKIIMEFRNRLQERHFANKLLNTPVIDNLFLPEG